MPVIPNFEKAIIERAKLTRYLLNEAHPEGGPKAKFFMRFGFRQSRPAELEAALRAQAAGAAATVETRRTGVFYAVVGEIAAPDGRRPLIRTIWEIRNGETRPRLVTAVPHRRRP